MDAGFLAWMTRIGITVASGVRPWAVAVERALMILTISWTQARESSNDALRSRGLPAALPGLQTQLDGWTASAPRL